MDTILESRSKKKQEWAIEKLLCHAEDRVPEHAIRETVVLKTTRANVSEVKKRLSCIEIAGKGRNSVLYCNFVQEFVLMKRSDQSSSPNFLLKVKAKRMLSRLATQRTYGAKFFE